MSIVHRSPTRSSARLTESPSKRCASRSLSGTGAHRAEYPLAGRILRRRGDYPHVVGACLEVRLDPCDDFGRGPDGSDGRWKPRRNRIGKLGAGSTGPCPRDEIAEAELGEHLAVAWRFQIG